MADNGTIGHVQTLSSPKPAAAASSAKTIEEQRASDERVRQAQLNGLKTAGNAVWKGIANLPVTVLNSVVNIVPEILHQPRPPQLPLPFPYANEVEAAAAQDVQEVGQVALAFVGGRAPKAASGTNGVVVLPKRLSRKTEYPHGNKKKTRDEVIQKNTDKNGDVIDPNTGEVIPKDQVTIEHKKPVVEHWNEEGFNQSKQQRTDWYNDTSNLTVKSKSLNSSEGAKLGQTYRQDTGPNYSK